MNSQSKLVNLIDNTTAEFFLELGRLNKDEVLDIPEIKYIFTKNWQSRIFMTNFSELNASKNIIHVISRIKELKIPVLWFVTPMSRPKNLKKILKDHGFTYQNNWRAMAIDLKTVSERFNVPEGMTIKEVLNLEDLKIWTDVLVKSFEFPIIVESYKKYFINAGLENLNFHYYLGLFNDKPVSSSVLFKGDRAAGIFYIGTIPKARGKGLAKTMVYYILNKARNEGYDISILQASEMGYPLYKKVGFKEYYTTKIYKLENPF